MGQFNDPKWMPMELDACDVHWIQELEGHPIDPEMYLFRLWVRLVGTAPQWSVFKGDPPF